MLIKMFKYLSEFSIEFLWADIVTVGEIPRTIFNGILIKK